MSDYQYVKEWKKRNPDKVRQYDRAYRERHPETAQRASLKYRETHAEQLRTSAREHKRRERNTNPELEKERIRRFKERREAMLTMLAGRERPTACEICLEACDRTVYDHCHSCGMFRGWLCDRCNRTLGTVQESTALLQKMIAYLGEDHGTPNLEETQLITKLRLRLTQ